ncbi:MAG TPA: SAM-dependent methyltransferase [Actinospica sp.]|nr:SAM-dependent methyltransferase [Actinospica sp.]HWG25895.1 SAM-dependent methyltransferase [Actinospica sp.]
MSSEDAMNNHVPPQAPEVSDFEKPSTARMYDYYLGGSHNFEADRALAQRTIEIWPDAAHQARANRAFLRRSVAYLAEAGIDQFLDLGSGIPTSGNVHEVVGEVNPAAHVVYVDADAVAVAHSKGLLAHVPEVAAIQADLRDPQSVLGNPTVTALLDFDRPVALLTFAVLHFVPEEDDPAAILATYRDATAPGSYLALSHWTNEYRPESARLAEDVYAHSSHSARGRSREEIRALMAGYELLEPGLVDIIDWRPDPQSAPDPLGGDVTRYSALGAVGRKV